MFNEWYLARDEGSAMEEIVVAYPTVHLSITKHKGCVAYKTDRPLKVKGRTYHSGWGVTPRDCKRYFGHCPKKGELLCVKKTRKGWKAEKIELEFTD